MNNRNLHVVPAGESWAVKPEGSPHPMSTHRTQAAAEEAAKGVARLLQGEVVIHRPNGQIRDKDSFGADPFPPRDRKH